MMKVRFAKEEDYGLLLSINEDVDFPDFQKWAIEKRVMLIYENEDFCGWLQFGFFKEKYPFINRFYITEEYRGIGNGTLTLLIWERQMMERMYDTFLVSVKSDDKKTTDFFEKHGYKKIGAFAFPESEEETVYYKHNDLYFEK